MQNSLSLGGSNSTSIEEAGNIDPLISSASVYQAWGANSSIIPNIPKLSAENIFSTDISLKIIKYNSRQLLQRINEHDFLFIIGSRIAVYDTSLSLENGSALTGTTPTILLPTLPSIEYFQSIHLSYPNEKYLASPVRLRGLSSKEESSIASMALYDFPSISKYSNASYTSVHPRLLRYKRSKVSTGIENNQTMPSYQKTEGIAHGTNINGRHDTGSDDRVAYENFYEFISVSFFKDSSQLAAITNDQEDGVLIFNTISAFTNSNIGNNTILPVRTLPSPSNSCEIYSFSFHPNDNNKFVVNGSGNMFTFWRYAGTSLRSAPLTGLPSITNDSEIYTCHEWVGDNLLLAGTCRGDILLIQGCEVLCVVRNIFHSNDSSNVPYSHSSSAKLDSNITKLKGQYPVSKILSRENVILCCCYSEGLIASFELKKFLSSARQDVSARIIPLARYNLVQPMPNTTSIGVDSSLVVENNVEDVNVMLQENAPKVHLKGITSIDWCYKLGQSIDEILVLTDTLVCSYELHNTAHTKEKVFDRITSSSASLVSQSSTSTLSVLNMDNEKNLASNFIRPKKIFMSFHAGAVSSMAISARESCFLTFSSQDKSVHIRNYLGYDEVKDRDMLTTRPIPNGEISDPINSPVCAAFHPSGYYVTMGSEEQLIEYAIADKRLKELRAINLRSPFYLTSVMKPTIDDTQSTERPYHSTSCVSVQAPSVVRYSNGGHLLAVISGKVLRVYHMMKLDYHNADVLGVPALILATNEHSANLSDFYFTHDDADILCSSYDGYVYSWHIATSTKECDYYMRATASKVMAVGWPLSSNSIGRSLLSMMNTNNRSNTTAEDKKSEVGTIIASFSSFLGSTAVPNTAMSSATQRYGIHSSNSRPATNASIATPSTAGYDDIRPNYIAIWRHDSSKQHNRAKSKRRSTRINSMDASHIQNNATPLLASMSANEMANSGLNPFPELIVVESPVLAASLGWCSDGLNRVEVCVLGCEDGRIIISLLPFPFKVVNLATAMTSNVNMTASSKVVVTGLNHTRLGADRTDTKHAATKGLGKTNTSSTQFKGKSSSIPISELVPLFDISGFEDDSNSLAVSLTSDPSHSQSGIGSRNGMSTGGINISKSYNVLNESVCKVLALHHQSVTNVIISPSGSYIFTSGQDGCVYMLQIQPTNTSSANGLGPSKIMNGRNIKSSKFASSASKRLLQLGNNNHNGIYNLPEGKNNEDNEILFTDKHIYLSMKRRLRSLDASLEDLRQEQKQSLLMLQEEIAEQKESYELKLKNEIAKNETISLKYKQDYQNLQKQVKAELEVKESAYQAKYNELEAHYENKYQRKQEHLATMKQAYDEYVCNLNLDLSERDKIKDSKIEEVKNEKKKFEDEVSQQKKAVELYVKFMNQRNQEIFDSIEEKHVQERLKFKKEIESLKEEIEIKKKDAQSDSIFYHAQLQKAKIEYQAKEEQATKLSSELEWNRSRVETLDREVQLLHKEIETKTAAVDRWEEKSKEQQQQIYDLEKSRKSLTIQLHELREEMNPKELKLHKTNEMMSEMEGEYLSLMQKIQEKENSLQQSHVNVLSLQKQLRDIRKQSAQKDVLLRRTAKLFEEYKVFLKEGEGHKALLKLASRLGNPLDSTALMRSSVNSRVGSALTASGANAFDKQRNDVKTANDSSMMRQFKTKEGLNSPSFVLNGATGRIIEDLDVTLSRIDDLLQQFQQNNTDELVIPDDEAVKTREERDRHIHYLHASINGLKTNLTHSKSASKVEVTRKIQDNQTMLDEVNELRHELRDMAQDNQRLQATIEFTERKYRKKQEEVLRLKAQLSAHNQSQIPSDNHLSGPTNDKTEDHDNQSEGIDLDESNRVNNRLFGSPPKSTAALSDYVSVFSINSAENMKSVQSSSLQQLSIAATASFISDRTPVDPLKKNSKKKITMNKKMKITDELSNLLKPNMKIKSALSSAGSAVIKGTE